MNYMHMSSRNTSRALGRLAFYASDSHACSYLTDKQAVSIFADPNAAMSVNIYSQLINYGFRRSGEHIYAPQCPGCDACVPLRVVTKDFQLQRRQRRNLNLNAGLTVKAQIPEFNPEHFQLYQQYLSKRHAGSSMENPSKAEYMNFLTSSWCKTYFYEVRDETDTLVAVFVADKLVYGFSAVYTFFDPAKEKLGLGNFAILWLIEEARKQELPFVYLGYWIAQCDKMRYKSSFQPAEIFRNGKWFNFHQKDDLGS